METFDQSAGFPGVAGAARGHGAARPASSRAGRIEADPTVRELVHAYMAAYAGRDTSRGTRLAWWSARIGERRLSELDDDEVYFALEDLATQRGRYFAGLDADGRSILRAKSKPLSPATLNRYQAALSALLTWAIKSRRAPRGWANPCLRLGMRTENNERVRFLSDDERTRLLEACRASTWPRLYLMVLMALTTGARRGELEGMRWRDIDFERAEARVALTKNGEPKVHVLLPAVLGELRRHVGAPSALLFASSRRPGQAFNSVPAWHRALKAAKVRDFRFHDLRHSCASYLAQNGASLLEIADVLGHKQLTVTKRYSHLTTKHKAALVGRVLGGIR